jgi:hypothetical protein
MLNFAVRTRYGAFIVVWPCGVDECSRWCTDTCTTAAAAPFSLNCFFTYYSYAVATDLLVSYIVLHSIFT